MTETLLSLEFKGVDWILLIPALLLLAPLLFYSFRSSVLLEHPGWRRLLLGLRAAATAAVIILLLQPALTLRKAEVKKSPFRILVDASPSMRRGSDAMNRAAAFLERNRKALRTLAGRHDLSLICFSADTAIDSLGGLPVSAALPFKGATKLSDALEFLEGERLAGILLLTDGIHEDPLFTRHLMGERLFSRGSEFSECRFYPVDLLADTGRFDIAVTAATADDFAYVKNPFNLKVRLRVNAPRAMIIPVRAGQGDAIAASAEIKAAKGEGEYEATLTITPEKAGYFLCRVTVPGYAFENRADNNRAEIAVKVIRDRIRVMHVAGRPSWDVRFLRNTLKKDPAVDLIAFYILRTASDWIDVPQDELSLIEFPHRDLFEKDINTFDVIIFQNFSYRMFFGQEYLDNIRKFVENGGAFLMIGGDLAFADGGYRGTAIEPILPCKLAGGAGGFHKGAFRARLTQAGQSHPILAESPELAGFMLEGLNPLGGAMEGSLQLLENEKGMPLLGLRDIGKGRTAALATDGLWRFNFESAGKGRGNRAYQEMVRRLIRWLIKDPALGTVAIQGLRPVQSETRPVAFNLRMSASPAGQNAVVSLFDGRGRLVERKSVRPERNKPLPVEFRPPGPGLYLAAAELYRSGTLQEKVAEAFTVSATSEYGDPSGRRAYLMALAAQTRGEIIAREETSLADRIKVPEKTIKRILSRETRPLWNTRAMLCLVALLFAVEWFLRKRKGLA